jgi:SNF2 family DNA or RNA helicase
MPNYKYEKDESLCHSVQDLPLVTYRKLLKYQKKGVDYAIKHYGRILLGDEMGVGKTLQAICIARVYIEDWPVLIICPSALKFNWQEEFVQWLEEISKEDIQILHKGKDEFIKDKKASHTF